MKIDAITQKLEEGLESLLNSDNWTAYLDTLSRFHHYSFNNCVLILMQCPEASRVAGYKKWQEFGRQVRKGEKAIQILAPVPHKKVVQDGDEEKVIRWNTYRVVSVFDVSQTDGDDLPEICRTLTDGVDGYEDMIRRLTDYSAVPVVFEAINGSTKGYYSKADNKIAVKENMSQAQTIKTLVHEIAHSLMHADSDKDRSTKEIEAESVAYTVCQHFGIETGEYSFGYLASWSGGDRDALKKSMAAIQQTADKIITGI